MCFSHTHLIWELINSFFSIIIFTLPEFLWTYKSSDILKNVSPTHLENIENIFHYLHRTYYQRKKKRRKIYQNRLNRNIKYVQQIIFCELEIRSNTMSQWTNHIKGNIYVHWIHLIYEFQINIYFPTMIYSLWRHF